MESTILYPFSIEKNNEKSYLKTLKLAEELNAKVICLTTVDVDEGIDDAYLHLLRLNGYYQSQHNAWSDAKVPLEKVIEVGAMATSLPNTLEEKQIDVMIRRRGMNRLQRKVILNRRKAGKETPSLFQFND